MDGFNPLMLCVDGKMELMMTDIPLEAADLGCSMWSFETQEQCSSDVGTAMEISLQDSQIKVNEEKKDDRPCLVLVRDPYDGQQSLVPESATEQKVKKAEQKYLYELDPPENDDKRRRQIIRAKRLRQFHADVKQKAKIDFAMVSKTEEILCALQNNLEAMIMIPESKMMTGNVMCEVAELVDSLRKLTN